MQTAYNFCHAAKKMFYPSLTGIVFRYIFVQRFPKNVNYEDFLAKLVNIDNHTHHSLHGMVILQEAKHLSQNEEIFAV